MKAEKGRIAAVLCLAISFLYEPPSSSAQESEPSVIRACVDRHFGRIRLLGFSKRPHNKNQRCKFFETEITLVPATGGKVGIGTADPVEALDVVGNIHSSGTISSGNSIEIDGTGRHYLDQWHDSV